MGRAKPVAVLHGQTEILCYLKIDWLVLLYGRRVPTLVTSLHRLSLRSHFNEEVFKTQP